MSRSSGFARAALSVSLATLLAACGGGGGGPSLPGASGAASVLPNVATPAVPGTPDTPAAPGNPTGGSQQPVGAQDPEGIAALVGTVPGPDMLDPNADVRPIDESSFWTVDQYRYVAGGHAHTQVSQLSERPVTIWNTSTATLGGGTDRGHANGAFTGSVVQFLFSGTEGGTFRVVPNSLAFGQALETGARVVLVELHVGTAAPGLGATAGSAMYYASGGQVEIRRDADGKYRFSSVGSLPVAKVVETLGGIAGGSPDTMTLTLNDVR